MTDQTFPSGAAAQAGPPQDELSIAKRNGHDDAIDHIRVHWFTQGGAAQFGHISFEANNADTVVSEILQLVRAALSASRTDPPPCVHQHEHQAQQFWREIRDVDGVRWFWVKRCVCGDEISSQDTGPMSRTDPAVPSPPAQESVSFGALTDAGIVNDHGTLRWTFRPHQALVTSSGGTLDTRVSGLLRQVGYLIDGMLRRAALSSSSVAESPTPKCGHKTPMSPWCAICYTFDWEKYWKAQRSASSVSAAAKKD